MGYLPFIYFWKRIDLPPGRRFPQAWALVRGTRSRSRDDCQGGSHSRERSNCNTGPHSAVEDLPIPVTGRFIHDIVIGCAFAAVGFIVRYSDCSTNGISAMNGLMDMVVRKWR